MVQAEIRIIDQNNNCQTVSVCAPMFTIGRSKECHLRFVSTHVSRRHCILYTHGSTVTIQDLGGENGTHVNGRRISSQQRLQDGDRIQVGPYEFVVNFKKTGRSIPEILPPDMEQTQPAEPENEKPKSEIIEKTVVPIREAELTFEIQCEGQFMSITKSRLFRLAQRGVVKPDDEITVCGTKIFVSAIQGIVFGN